MPRRINVARLRSRLGISQQTMADALHTDVRTIRRWEAVDHDPSPMATDALRRLMTAKGVTDAPDEEERPTPPSTAPARVKLRGILPSIGST